MGLVATALFQEAASVDLDSNSCPGVQSGDFCRGPGSELNPYLLKRSCGETGPAET